MAKKTPHPLEGARSWNMMVPSYQNTFRRLMLDQWTDSQTAWIGNKEWELCQGEIDLERLKDKECWGGLDLASTRDISALVLIFKEDDKFLVVPYFFIPEDNAKKRSDRDKVDYVTWIKQNHVIFEKCIVNSGLDDLLTLKVCTVL